MSGPFLSIVSGFALVVVLLMFGGKGGVPIAFVVGGGMILGGLFVGLIRSLPGQRKSKEVENIDEI